ncbi:hemerythrin domain-containing protein [Alcanivorax sediminis]|nr:hemerythrin domain-containing protein [Alcanivorax sediminis]
MSIIAIPSVPLPATVRQSLLPLDREQWREHEHFLTSDARALLRNHGALKRQARQYHGALTHLLNLRDQDLGTGETQELAQVIKQHLQGLLRNLHSHHGFEDSSVFPAFKLQHPRLGAAIELMEQDHHALDQLLEVLRLRSQQSAQALRLRSEVESARLEADHLEQMLHGHMQNEEEILVPVYLTYG